jgi:hypothetical protein
MSFMSSIQDLTEPLPSGIFLFALAHPVSCCLLQWLTFHLPHLLTAYTSKRHFSITSYTHGHAYLHHINIINSSFLHFFHPFWQAGCPRPFPSGIRVVPVNRENDRLDFANLILFLLWFSRKFPKGGELNAFGNY